MQISFVKDLATLRDPRSHFTFLNYLHKNDRLVEFTNLSTFLPARIEYEDYLRWCASFFSDVVRYNNEVVSVVPDIETSDSVRTFTVVSRNTKTGAITKHRARNVVLAVGGQPSIPQVLPANHPKVVHSSQYAHMIPKILKNKDAPYRVAVVGAGQSAAEIFNNIQVMYPNSKTSLVMKSEFLKPSDDSPFVNSIFNPEFVDVLYPRPPQYRQSLISDAKATNYGVVRLELIEKLYEVMYDQRREIGSDETKWPHRILGGRRVVGVEETSNGLRLRVRHAPAGEVALEADGLVDVETQESAKAVEVVKDDDELLDVDLIIAATGYRRNAHVEMLKDAWHLLPQNKEDNPERSDQWAVRDVTKTCRVMEVSRDYRVQFRPGVVAPGSGVWLQGCCEGTHGLSDTLLSVLATRSGEMVKSIFGTKEGSVVRAHL
ncbi:putative l-ornithine 5-monooxygenase (l-ornithine n -oxygenase) protein [Phaeoacremonium minimum UCRPA7]|uniref:L-ornithine N(5)-monooxygenase [NAD(P)H] n=1 Tax=Phaeoacremonium minimum (strain UCR-PA7) TaxID=1286976 RepID=R8BD51_PHAM7|nr:putative l-ornithine 5-monooxygenase (l-ornithine n -oxygenase) protein [Phaeoacremonium minimum UCRPA7]EON97221.1 putative l-ornithine 5-monooxygenase (l-ornithine n -oxygenase) protein [Phaeoacremonium minimum UCRPA7]